MAEFLPVVNEVIDKMEGLYSNDLSDPGGETNWGFTIDTARDNGYTKPMIEMTRDEAVELYRKVFWNRMLLNDCPSQPIAKELFESAVNLGVEEIMRNIQRILNVLNQNQKEYSDLIIDGNFGPRTRDTLIKALSIGKESNILKALNCLQGYHYIIISEKKPILEKYTNGWVNKRIT